MNTYGHAFWWALTMGCVAWYAVVTGYVAFKGAFDIKHMLARLKGQNLDEERR